jgi:hypothetical protein
MANKNKFTKTMIMMAIRGNPDLPAPIVPKSDDGDDWITAAITDNPQLSSHGHVPTIAGRLMCSEQTVRNYINERERLPEHRVLLSLLKNIRECIRNSDTAVYGLVKEMSSVNQGNRFGLADAVGRLIDDLDNPDAKLNPILAEIRKQIVKNTWGDYTKQALEIQESIEHEKHVVYSTACEEIRHEIKTDAQKMLHLLVKSADGPSVRFALERLDKEHYAARNELTGAEGLSLFDDEARKALGEIAELLDETGKDPSEAIIDALHKYKSKLVAHKNKGKNNNLSTGRGESDVKPDR